MLGALELNQRRCCSRQHIYSIYSIHTAIHTACIHTVGVECVGVVCVCLCVCWPLIIQNMYKG